ncbi:MAG: hypothetical protein NTV58_14570 [Deltaproteobacteria bacterium]|nr:hypothetical protein [Deltaproteobacteria bacterium]
MALYTPYGTFASMLASLKNRSQLTGTKYNKRDVNSLASGYFSDALNATNTDRAWDLQSASQTLAEKAQAAQEAQNAALLDQSANQFNANLAQNANQFNATQATSADQFSKTLAEQKRIEEARQNAVGDSQSLGNVQTGLSAGMLGANLWSKLGTGESGPMEFPDLSFKPTLKGIGQGVKDAFGSNTATPNPLDPAAEALAKAKSAATETSPGVFNADTPPPPIATDTTGTLGDMGSGVSTAATTAGEAAAAQLGGAPSYAASLGYGAPVLESSAPVLSPAASLYAAPAAGEVAPALAGETLGSVLGPLGAAYGVWDLGVTLGGGKSPSGAAVNQLIEQTPGMINTAGQQISSAFGGGVTDYSHTGMGSYGSMAELAVAQREMEGSESARIAAANDLEYRRANAPDWGTRQGEYTMNDAGQIVPLPRNTGGGGVFNFSF